MLPVTLSHHTPAVYQAVKARETHANSTPHSRKPRGNANPVVLPKSTSSSSNEDPAQSLTTTALSGLFPGEDLQVRFLIQPTNLAAGSTLAPVIIVQVVDALGLPILTPVQVSLSLVSTQAGALLTGSLQQTTLAGLALFPDLSINAPGAGYQLQATVDSLPSVVSDSFAVVPPAGVDLTFTPPPANTCHSNYDTFYSTEPGVYAFWPLCESSPLPAFYDYVGRYDLNTSKGSWFSGPADFVANSTGPVSDAEGATQINTASSFYAAQNIVLNANGGTAAVWVNSDPDQYFNSMLAFEAVAGNSKIWLGTLSQAGSTCFQGKWVNTDATEFFTSSACGYVPGSWHRVALTWSHGLMSLYVDGANAATGAYDGTLDDKVFVYRLFPEAVDNGKPMALAKATLSNTAWGPLQAAADFNASLPSVPEAGVLVTDQQLGTVHRDVLGFADNQSTLTPDTTAALVSGLRAAGVTSVRYANGSSGIAADLTDWQGTLAGSCATTPPLLQTALSTVSQDSTETYVPGVAQPLGLSLGYTVNYGTNPPQCNGGGDPFTNGADLVRYLNLNKGYGFKYFEIGNELYNGGGSETDLHSQPRDGASYGANESAFYNAMKAVDPNIQIGIPVGLGHIFEWVNNWTLPAMTSATYDSAILHNYPTQDPVTDAATLYPERIASQQGSARGDLLTLQTLLLNAGKSPESIWVTEWNDNANGGGPWSRQTLGAASPLFAAMSLGEYMNAGVQWATWFAQYGQTNYCNPFNYDPQAETSYSAVDWCSGSFLVYTGAIDGETEVGFHAGDLSPVGQTFSLISQSGFISEGEHMLRTFNDDRKAPWLLSYASTHGSGVAVILINRDRDVAHTIPLQISSKSSGGPVQQWTYGRQQYDTAFQNVWSSPPVTSISDSWSGTFNATLPPWSVNIFVF